MRYGLGESLADYGFGFFEKIHEPIFLVRRSGAVLKVNEAGRKLLSVMQVSKKDAEGYIGERLHKLFERTKRMYSRMAFGQSGIAIVRRFQDSDLFLIELVKAAESL